MADEYRDEHALDRFWDGLFAVGEPVAGDGGLDPELADALRRVHALSRTPPPAGVSARLDAWMLAYLDSTATSEVSIDMLGTQALPFPGPRISVNGRVGNAEPDRRPTRSIRRSLSVSISWLTAAALIAATFALIVIVARNQQHAGQPPVQLSPSVATPGAHAWPVWGGNATHSFTMPGPAPQGQPVLLWKFPADGQQGLGTAPDGILVADGVAYLAGSSALVAVDAASGKELWRTTEAGGSGAIDGDGLIMRSSQTTGTGYDLLRVNRNDGSVVWSAEQGAIPLGKWAPVLDGGLGFTPSGGDLLAFDPATGNQVWRTPLRDALSAGPVVDDGRVIIGDEKGTVIAFDAKTGKVAWSYQAEPEAIGGLSLAGGNVHFATTNGLAFQFHTLDAATGTLQHSFATQYNGLIGGGAVAGGTGYVMNGSGTISAFDLATGAVRWTDQTDAKSPNSTVLAGETAIVAGADGTLYAIDAATGSERWRFAMGGRSDAVPTVVDGVVYVSTGTSVLAVGGTTSTGDRFEQTADASPTAGTVANPAASQVAQFLWQTSGGSQPFTTFVSQVTVAPDGRVWVADGARNQFQIFNPDGTFAEAWGTPGSGDGQFNFIRASNGNTFGAIAFAPDGSFYVADLGNFRVQKFDKDRNFLFAWGTAGTGNGQFIEAFDVALDADGNVFVLDDKRDDVQKFTPDGTFLLKFGGAGADDGELDFPSFMTVDPDGNVWVSDSTNGRIEIWANDGTFLASWNGGGRAVAATDIVVDAHGRAFVTETDSNFSGVLVLDRFGRVIGSFGSAGTGDGQFTVAAGIALDSEGNVYVTDMIGPVTRLEKFKLLPPLAPA